jgi:hypothetical protein
LKVIKLAHSYLVDENAAKEVPLDADVNEILNCRVEVTAVGLRGEQLDLLHEMEGHHPALGACNSCFFLASLVASW